MAVLIGILVALLVGVLPVLVYAVVLWWFDRYEKEPLGLLVASFLWGAAPAVAFSLIAELALDVPVSIFVEPTAANLIGATVIAPVAEELFKGAALLLLFLFFRQEIDSPLDGIIYGGLVGFGFAAVENVFYFTETFMEAGVGGVVLLATLRTFLFGLNHALFTGLTGLGVALARAGRGWLVKVGAPIAGWAAGVSAHAIHNASVTLGADLGWPCLVALISDWGGVLVLLVMVVWSTLRERQWIVTYLVGEVAEGTLSQAEYRTTSSSISRLSEQAAALFSGDLRRWWALRRYHRLATELAFSKHRLARFPGEEETRARADRLREQVRGLGDRLIGAGAHGTTG